jgi:alanine racemase
LAEDARQGSDGAAILTIDTRAIAANWRKLADRVPRSECAAAVKADAYGTGLATTVSALTRAGCRTFFVAHHSEAVAVRAAAPPATIYVLNGFAAGAGDAYARSDLRPVLNTLEEIDEWSAFVRSTSWAGSAAIHFDTGMNRLGLPVDVSPRLEHVRLSLVMSHFACAEDRSHPLNALQIARFRELIRHFPGIPASLANSSGLFLDGDLGFDVARPGYALYGGNPTPGEANPMAPVVRLEAPILQIRRLESGESVGYGATWAAARPTRLAIIGVGYGDGYLRAGSSAAGGAERARVAIGDRLCPVVGRISMDLTAVDVTDLEEGAARRGMMADIIGPSLPIDEVGRRSGTIGYEILTSLGSRYHRRYLGAAA